MYAQCRPRHDLTFRMGGTVGALYFSVKSVIVGCGNGTVIGKLLTFCGAALVHILVHIGQESNRKYIQGTAASEIRSPAPPNTLV